MPVVRLRLPRAGDPLRLQMQRVMRGSPQVFVRSRLRRASFLQPAIKAVARKILAAAGEPGAELSLDLVGDRRMRRLNREYRGRDLPTDVLAFPMREAATRGTPDLLGGGGISLHTADRPAPPGRRAM